MLRRILELEDELEKAQKKIIELEEDNRRLTFEVEANRIAETQERHKNETRDD